MLVREPRRHPSGCHDAANPPSGGATEGSRRPSGSRPRRDLSGRRRRGPPDPSRDPTGWSCGDPLLGSSAVDVAQRRLRRRVGTGASEADSMRTFDGEGAAVGDITVDDGMALPGISGAGARREVGNHDTTSALTRTSRQDAGTAPGAPAAGPSATRATGPASVTARARPREADSGSRPPGVAAGGAPPRPAGSDRKSVV